MVTLVAVSLCMLISVALAPPALMSVDLKQTQFQWRTPPWGGPIEDGWSWIDYDYITDWDFKCCGNVLHTEITYLPYVSEEEGTSMVYVYDKKEDRWILHEGTIGYVSPYSGLWITEYWKGYLNFSGTPSDETFEHGVGYQWGYVFADEKPEYYEHAIWDETIGGWLLGFSIYLWDPTDADQQTMYEDNVPFPDPFIEPVPKSDYNPLGH